MPTRSASRSRTVQAWVLGCASIIAPGAALAQAEQVLATVNRLRGTDGACAIQAPPLHARAALDTAAASIARGSSIEVAMQTAGYRATRAQVLRLEGSALRLQFESLLAQRYCAQVGSVDLSELGFHAAGDRWWIVLAAPFAPHVDLSARQLREGMLALVNRARAQPRSCGAKAFDAAPPLAWNDALASAAQSHASAMATRNYFSHTGHDGSTPAQRVEHHGYRYRATGENIAAGNLTLEAAMAGWLQSPGHCAALMNSRFTEMGAAFAVNPASRMGIYWAQSFGLPR